jgi:amino acid transporter
VVCLAVIIIFRYTRPDTPRSFRLPLMPVVPAFGVLASLFLILQLQWETWVRFAVWLVIGLIITSPTVVNTPCSALTARSTPAHQALGPSSSATVLNGRITYASSASGFAGSRVAGSW